MIISTYLWGGNRICSLLCEASPQTGVQNAGNWLLSHLKHIRMKIYSVKGFWRCLTVKRFNPLLSKNTLTEKKTFWAQLLYLHLYLGAVLRQRPCASSVQRALRSGVESSVETRAPQDPVHHAHHQGTRPPWGRERSGLGERSRRGLFHVDRTSSKGKRQL